MDEPLPADLLAQAAARRPDAVALRVGTASWTYAELDYAATEVAGRVPAGERIAFRAEMSAASVVATWGIPRGGGVAVPIDPALDVAAAARRASGMGAVLGWPQRTDALRHDRELNADAPAYILATSGSSAEPRGAVITFGNIAAATFASQLHLGTGAGDRWLLALPLHHVAGLAILWRAAHDASEVVVHDRFEAGRFAAELESGITWTSVVPTMLRRLVDQPQAWSGVSGVLVGGAPSSPDLIDQANRAGLPALATYGMTETTAQVCTVQPGSAAAARGTVGYPLPDVVVTIDGRPGEPGRILVAGPTVSPGYVDAPPREGPLRTRDIGRFDAAGRLEVMGRADDVIITGGENVYPQRVEAVLLGVPGVTGAVVYGAEDIEWGEQVIAIVSGPVDARLVRDAVAASLQSHEVPKTIHVVAELPKLSTGKIDRMAARRLNPDSG